MGACSLWRRLFLKARAWAAIAAILMAAPALAQDPPADSETEKAIVEAFDRGDAAGALAIIEAHLKENPDSPLTLYNAACACCVLKRIDEAAEYLLKAVKAGFREFDHMEADEHLAGLREHETFKAIVEAKRRLDEKLSTDQVEKWKAMFGAKGYRYETDEYHKLHYATALDERAHVQMRQMLDKQADQMIATLFEAPPSYYVFIAVPTPADAAAFFAELGKEDPKFKSPNVAGLYEHRPRRLVAKDIGATLRHEFVHLMHYGHMERLKQQHPLWIQEGLASLYEDYTLVGSSITFLPNDRSNVVQRNVKGARTAEWPDLFGLSASKFMMSAGALYPQVRSIFEYLAAEKKLAAWYKEYTTGANGYSIDKSGAKAMEAVFSKPLKEIEKGWKAWVREQPEVQNQIRPGDAWLGCEIEDSNDGAKITRIVERLGDGKVNLRLNDVITAIDDEPVRSAGDVVRAIAGREVGSTVKLTIRRSKVYKTLRINLIELKPFVGV